MTVMVRRCAGADAVALASCVFGGVRRQVAEELMGESRIVDTSHFSDQIICDAINNRVMFE